MWYHPKSKRNKAPQFLFDTLSDQEKKSIISHLNANIILIV